MHLLMAHFYVSVLPGVWLGKFDLIQSLVLQNQPNIDEERVPQLYIVMYCIKEREP